MCKVQAIFFDNDGVLVDTEKLYFQAVEQVLSKVRISFSKEMFRKYFLQTAQGIYKILEPYGYSLPEIEQLRRERNEIYEDLLGRAELAIPGVEQVLEAIHGRFFLGVVTSTLREHFELIHQRTGFHKYFDFVLAHGDYQASKPAPDPYLRALEKSGCTKEQCLVVEDAERGLRAAAAAGLRCWIIPTELTQGSDFSQADRVLASITELPELL